MNNIEVLKRRYDAAVALNNRLATQNPAFAQRLLAMRQESARIIQSTPAFNGRAGMGFFQTPLFIIPVTIGGVGVLLVVALGLRWLTQREERAAAMESPILAAMNSATSALWAAMIIGGIALGGLVYWDWRKGGQPWGKARGARTDRYEPPRFTSRRTSRQQSFVGTPTDTGVVVGDADFELVDDD